MKAIQKRLDIPYLNVIKNIPTRWMGRIVLLKESHALYASSYSKVNILTKVENYIISLCIKLLKPFEETTKKINAPAASVSYVIPLISTLRKHFEPSSNENDNGLKRMKDVIKLKIEKCFGSVEINDLHTIATYLDSPYKASFFVTILEQVKLLLCGAVEKLQSEQSINSPPIKRKKTKSTEPTPSTSKSISDSLEEFCTVQ